MRAAATGLAGAALVLATACGGSSPSPSPAAAPSSRAAPVDAVSLVSAASVKTLNRRSARVQTTVASSTGLRLLSTGAYDYRRGNAVFDLTTTTSGRTSKQRIILVGGTAYLSMPGLGRAGQYIRLDLSSLIGRSGGSSFDQSTALNLLRGATGGLRAVGSEPVRGTPTTHVVGELDARKALAALPDARQRAALQRLTALARTPARIPVECWIDGDGVLRRMKQQVTVAAQQIAGISLPASTVTTTSEFYDFGVPVHVVRPPAGDVLG